MNCPRCHQPTEEGAAFCGNCGQALQPASPIAQALQNQPPPTAGLPVPNFSAPAPNVAGAAAMPGYAVADPLQHSGDTKALLALLFGIAGVAGALFMALIGLVLGIAGVVMGTMSRTSSKRRLSTAGLAVSILAILASLAVWIYAVQREMRVTHAAQSAQQSVEAPPVAASSLSTRCYTTDFADELNVSNTNGSCDMAAYNGQTLASSTDAYKIYAENSPTVTATNFMDGAKTSLEKDVHTNLKNFTITSEQVGQFANSPAYTVTSSNQTESVTVVEAAVLHRVAAGDNIFILVHAVNGRSADLNTLEANWQWK